MPVITDNRVSNSNIFRWACVRFCLASQRTGNKTSTTSDYPMPNLLESSGVRVLSATLRGVESHNRIVETEECWSALAAERRMSTITAPSQSAAEMSERLRLERDRNARDKELRMRGHSGEPSSSWRDRDAAAVEPSRADSSRRDRSRSRSRSCSRSHSRSRSPSRRHSGSRRRHRRRRRRHGEAAGDRK